MVLLKEKPIVHAMTRCKIILSNNTTY